MNKKTACPDGIIRKCGNRLSLKKTLGFAPLPHDSFAFLYSINIIIITPNLKFVNKNIQIFYDSSIQDKRKLMD